ncbi:MAG TPA: hypothetical protein VFI23_18570 [Rhizomicrobium sp.]|nr:hypothetical protein [Rhizomicrobium sp.]
MKRFACHLFAGWALIFALAQTAQSAPVIKISDPSLCVDGMQTDPDSDDSEPILAAVDGGCIVPPEGTISI